MHDKFIVIEYLPCKKALYHTITIEEDLRVKVF